MLFNNLPDDSEAKTGTSGAGSVEGFKELFRFSFAKPRAVVTDLHLNGGSGFSQL